MATPVETLDTPLPGVDAVDFAQFGANFEENFISQETLVEEESEKRFERLEVLRELFHERSSLLYHDILECISDESCSEVSTPRSTGDSLCNRHDKLTEQAELLVTHAPEMSDDVKYRMQMVNNGMQRLNRHESSSSGDEHGVCSSLSQLRKWLQITDDRLCYVELYDLDYVTDAELHRLHKQQQALQRRIERDGSTLVHRVEKQFETSVKTNRKRVVLSSLIRRWHGLWLRSLELQCRFEEQVKLCDLGLRPDLEESSELVEPAPKRRRLGNSGEKLQEEDENDTIPFDASEYVPIMENLLSDSDVEYRNEKGQAVYNRSAMVGDNSAIQNLKDSGSGPFEVIAQDVGYSSGENSMHEAVGDGAMILGQVKGVPRSPSDQLNNNSEPADELPSLTELQNSESPGLERRKRIEASPIKSYYKMTPLDDGGVTDTETPRAANAEGGQEALMLYKEQLAVNDKTLTESLVVQVGDSEVSAQKDLQEVLSLLDESIECGTMHRSAFGEELEKLVSEGTKWQEFVGKTQNDRGEEENGDFDDKDSCDASSELSDVDEVCTAENSDMGAVSPPVYSTPQSTLKRSRQRKARPNSLDTSLRPPGIPNSVSDNAIMCMSVSSAGDWLPDTQTTPTTSMSQSLWATLPRQNRSSARRKKLRARRMMPRSLSDGEHLSFLTLKPCNDNVPRISPLPLLSPDALPDFHDQLPDSSRADADGGSQSESNVWEWDDYKPPNHEETGTLEQKLDDSQITAFGDDYRMYLDTRARLSMDAERPTPIGLSSQESDSELEDLYHVINESHKQLRTAQQTFKSKDNINTAELLATCETNIRCLQAVTGHLLSQGPGHLYKAQDYGAATALLKDWQDLLFSCHQQLKHVNNGSNRDRAEALLQQEMARLSKTLKDLMEQGSINRSFTSATYNSLDDLLDAMDLFEDLHSRLQEERRRMRLLTKSVRSCSQTEPEIEGELAQLCVCCDQALDSCNQQISQLTHLRQSWTDWQDTLKTLQQLMTSLENKLTNVEMVKDHPGKADLNGKKDTKLIYAELQLCQDRMNRLETVCNYLVSGCHTEQSTSTVPDFRSQFELFGKQLEDLRERFIQLPDALEVCQCQENEKSERQRWSRRARRRRHSHKAKPKDSSSVPRRGWLRRVFGWCWPVHLCLLVLVCVGVAAVGPYCCQETNNWRWAWGPQLNYVKGPPPS